MWSADKQHSLTQHIYINVWSWNGKNENGFFWKKKYCFFCILPKVMYNIIRDFVLARIRYLFLLIASSKSSIFKRTKKNPSTSFFFPELQIICTAIHHLRPFNSSNGHFSSRTRLLPYKQKLKKKTTYLHGFFVFPKIWQILKYISLRSFHKE